MSAAAPSGTGLHLFGRNFERRASQLLEKSACGSAGVYNVTQTETSLELLAEKMRHVQSTRAQTIVTANPGCLLQLRVGVDIHHTHQEVLHVVELLDRAIASARAQK
ncbi:MAG: hypothetical protein DMG51_02040 [Acidobacteria bacterium]|nr:MAG: hypothetical protein DMG51_02040 [Acidobacteriota bacterium]